MMQTSRTDDDVDKIGALMTTVILVGSGVLDGLRTQEKLGVLRMTSESPVQMPKSKLHAATLFTTARGARNSNCMFQIPPVQAEA